MATCPFLCIDSKYCGLPAVWIASQATYGLPSVPFLKAISGAEARGQLEVNLPLGVANADHAPADHVADVLRTDGVEELAAGQHAQVVDVHQQLVRDAQAFVDVETAVEIGGIDQLRRAGRGARVLEVRPCHDRELASVLLALFPRASRVVQRRQNAVDRAGADDHEQPLVIAMQDPLHRLARVLDQPLHRRAGDRAEADRVLVQRQRQRPHVLDALIVGFARLLAQCKASFASWRRWPRRALRGSPRAAAPRSVARSARRGDVRGEAGHHPAPVVAAGQCLASRATDGVSPHGLGPGSLPQSFRLLPDNVRPPPSGRFRVPVCETGWRLCRSEIPRADVWSGSLWKALHSEPCRPLVELKTGSPRACERWPAYPLMAVFRFARPVQAAALVQAQSRRMRELSADTAALSERARPPARASPPPTARCLDLARSLWPQLAVSG